MVKPKKPSNIIKLEDWKNKKEDSCTLIDCTDITEMTVAHTADKQVVLLIENRAGILLDPEMAREIGIGLIERAHLAEQYEPKK